MVARTRIFTLALLALFAAGIVVGSVGTTAMSLKMALGDAGIGDMADCQGCGADTKDEDSGLSCEIVCLAPLFANLNPDAILVAGPDASPESTDFYDFVRRLDPPDPDPPRLLI